MPSLNRELRAGSGVMVGLWLDPMTAAALAIEGGEAPGDLHLTIAYLGKAGEVDAVQIEAVVRQVAAATPPLAGTISGVGRFTAQEGEPDVLHATVDAPGLAELRVDLVRALEAAGVTVRANHGFDPHVTLAYLDPGSPAPIDRIEQRPIAFDALTLAVAGERIAVPLAGEAPANRGLPGVSTTANPQREVRQVRFNALRVDAERGIVTGVAYPAFNPEDRVYTIDELRGRVDSWATFMRAATVEALAHAYLSQCAKVDQQHDRKTRAGWPVESHIARAEVATAAAVPDGSWLMAVQVSPEVLPDVRSGKLTGFSIDIYAARRQHAIRVTGKGEIADLNGVSEYPFIPKMTQVDGETTIRCDELLDSAPNFVSLVDRPGTGYQWEARADVPPAVTWHIERAAVPYKATPEGGPAEWDGAAAVGRLRVWAGVDAESPTAAAWEKYRQGFAWYDADKPDQLGSFKLPHHDIADGKLVLSRAGMLAAGASLQGARGGVDIPDADRDAVKAHLTEHYHALDLKAPWEDERREPDDEQPATRGWLRRLLDPVLRALGRDPTAANRDGTPPPALDLPPVAEAEIRVAVPDAPLAKEKPVPAPAADPATTAEKRAHLRLVRQMEPMDFATAWAAEDVLEDVQEATWLIQDVIWSILCNWQSYATPQAMFEEMARQYTAYLGALKAIFAAGTQDGATVMAQRQVQEVERALALLAPDVLRAALPPSDEETRAGKKYSAATVAKIKAAHAALAAVMEDVAAEEAKGKAEGETQMAAPPPPPAPAPAVEVSPEEQRLQSELAEAEAKAEAAEREAKRSEEERQRIADLEKRLAEQRARIATAEERRRTASAQLGGDGLPPPAAQGEKRWEDGWLTAEIRRARGERG